MKIIVEESQKLWKVVSSVPIMKSYPIATIINFCTNESRFLKTCIEEALSFSSQVIIPVCDHFFDGKAENRPLLEEIYQAFPECQFVEYPFIEAQVPKKIFKEVNQAHFWHSLSRLIASTFLREEIEHVLFLDADEIPDGKRFKLWLEYSDYSLHTALRLASYWYFREPCFQAKQWEDTPVLAQRKALDPHLLLHQDERAAIYNSLPGPKRRQVVGSDGEPMFHHYSWVRTEEEMLRKVQSWGHRKDRDWETLVKKEFTAPFQGVDFVHGYRFETVKPIFEIHLTPPSFPQKGKANVARLSPKEVLSTIKSGKLSWWKRLFG